jgi:hypothetical protein
MCINELVSIINHKQYEIVKLKTQNKALLKQNTALLKQNKALLKQNKALLKQNTALLKQNKALLSVETLKNNEILILKLHIQKLKKLKLINGFKSKYTIQLFPQ